jgi:hypothetical protein
MEASAMSSERDMLIDKVMFYGNELKQILDPNALQDDVLYLSDCAKCNDLNGFMTRVFELYYKANKDVPAELINLDQDLMSVFVLGMTTTKQKYKLHAVK